ncbi:uncharacterized protein [Ptychodera flava]|uniref:uncharacterized protein n=1 Tax=Ptychodera flava TaxID=63121 RepID=UPI003969BF66
MVDAGGPLSSTPVPTTDKEIKSQLSEIMETLALLGKQIEKISSVENRLSDPQKSVTYVSEYFENFRKEIKEIQLDTVQLKANNDRLQDQLTVTQRELSNTQEELHDLQQYSRRNNIEIHGIPQRNGEDTNDIVVRVAAAVGVDITPNDIDISHRLPSRQNPNQERHQPPAIIVKFVRRSVRNSIYYARKNLRGQTPNQIRIGDNNTNNIYINENLTPTMKRLFHQVNERRKQLKWRFIWTSNGKIFTRKDETSEVISVSSAKAENRIN